MILAAGEKLYGAGLQAVDLGFRWKLLKRRRLPAQVVSVGNLTWGGTGKTPLVIHLAQALQGQGRRVAVLTRGYGQDESKLLSDRLSPIPVLIGADRAASGERAVREHGADLLLLDDGYQQWRLHKDVEILTADAGAPFGNGRLIPRGTLRERPSAAARADLIVLKGEKSEPAAAQIRQFNAKAPLFFMRYEAQQLWSWPDETQAPLKNLKGKKVCTLAGIASPGSFEADVESLGAEPALRVRFRDHHPYTAGDLVRLFSRCRRHRIRTVVTTEKDAVRIPELFRKMVVPHLQEMELWVLEIKPRFEPDEIELLYRIRSLLDR